MRHRISRLVLIFSLGLNVAFVTLAAVRATDDADEGRALQRVDFSPRWHGRRAAFLGRTLHLEPEQRVLLREHLGAMRPELQAARRALFDARNTFRDALRRNDVPGARQARTRVSVAQAQVDSLSAEAMLAELAVLRPEQRERYLRWTMDPQRLRELRRERKERP